jgi:hypothetical protein
MYLIVIFSDERQVAVMGVEVQLIRRGSRVNRSAEFLEF